MSITKQIKQFYKANNKIAILLAFVMLCQIAGFLPNIPAVVNYALYLLFGIYVMSKAKENVLPVFLLLAYIPLEIMMADPNPLFQSWPRYALFAFLLMGVSPLFQSEAIRKLRSTVLQVIIFSCAFLGVGSFFCYFLGINYMSASVEDIYSSAGLFGGLVNHSMMLGPICGMGAIYLMSLAYKTKKRMYWALVACCIVCSMLSGSRSALMASVAGTIVALYRLSGSGARFAKAGVVVVVVAALTSSFWGNAMDRIIAKNHGNTSSLSIDSREELWLQRIDEFQSSPIVGVGFVSVDTKSSYGFNANTGQIESGSSWLSILSMTGILGFILTMSVIIPSFMAAWKRNRDEEAALLCGLLALMFIHMFAEGYVFSAGGFLCFALWLFVGCAYDQKYKV